jgi:hypothetical protein
MLGNPDGTNLYKIPVTWEVYDTIEVQGNSLEEALQWADAHKDEIPIGDEPNYLDDSYQIDREFAKDLNEEEMER